MNKIRNSKHERHNLSTAKKKGKMQLQHLTIEHRAYKQLRVWLLFKQFPKRHPPQKTITEVNFV